MNISDLLNKIFTKRKGQQIKTSSIIKPSIKDNYKKKKSRIDSSLKMEIVKSDHPDKYNVYNVRAKMIEATRIKRNNGYGEAIIFLKEVAEECLIRKISDLVLCVNKLIPYMRQDPNISYKETCEYLDGILNRMPRDEGYYLNLFITKAELLKINGINDAIKYLNKVLKVYKASSENINFYLKLSEYYIIQKKKRKANENILKAKELLKSKRERYSHLRKQKKLHELACLYSVNFLQNEDQIDYIFHHYMGFLMSIALVTSPQNARLFRQYRENYQTGTWDIAKDDNLDFFLSKVGLRDKKSIIHKELYTFAFEKMPEILGVTQKQLSYTRGDPESMEEISKKKAFPNKQFTQYYDIEAFVKDQINKNMIQ